MTQRHWRVKLSTPFLDGSRHMEEARGIMELLVLVTFNPGAGKIYAYVI